MVFKKILPLVQQILFRIYKFSKIPLEMYNFLKSKLPQKKPKQTEQQIFPSRDGPQILSQQKKPLKIGSVRFYIIIFPQD